jgi:ferredoxin-NADP reductase/DMSO/TMAO reductase YedYZ heme-binding membrane subunit
MHAAPGVYAPAIAPRPVPRWWRDAVGCAVWASLLVVTALWVAHGGLAPFHGSGDVLVRAGRLAGLVAADLLLLGVLMVARIPRVERVFGQDTLARWHRVLGFTSVTLMAVHIVAITVGYAATDRRNLLGEAWDLVWNYPGMLLATAGTAALVMVAGTSVRAARRRLRYESWHLLHLYTYLGVGLALPHEVWTGADFTASPWARAYWWGLYLAGAVSVLVFRVGLPVYRTFRHRLVVARVVREGPGVVSVHLRGRALGKLPVVAGQFFVWRFLDGPGASRGNPYSLSAAPHPGRLRITVKDLGDGSGRLAAIRPGTPVAVEGPFGRLTGAVRRGRKLTMVASGIGITPIRALLEELDYAPGEAVLLYRASTRADLIFRRELDQLAARRGIRTVYLFGRRAPGGSWLPAGAADGMPDDVSLAWLVPDIADHDVYVCGPGPWMDAVRAAAYRAGVPRDRVHTENFAW